MKYQVPKIFEDEKSQAILEAYLAEHGVVVYGMQPGGTDFWNFTSVKIDSESLESTHTSVMFPPQPIMAEKCAHDPLLQVKGTDGMVEDFKYYCRRCGVKLCPPKWEDIGDDDE